MSASIDDTLGKGVENACKALDATCKDCEEQIRSAPLASVLIAALIGYVLHFLPIGLIVRLKIRIFLALLRPALFLFGAYKLYEFIAAQVQANAKPLVEAVHEPVIDSPSGPAA